MTRDNKLSSTCHQQYCTVYITEGVRGLGRASVSSGGEGEEEMRVMVDSGINNPLRHDKG